MAGLFWGLPGLPGSRDWLCGRSQPNQVAFGVHLGSSLALCVFVGPRCCPEFSSVTPRRAKLFVLLGLGPERLLVAQSLACWRWWRWRAGNHRAAEGWESGKQGLPGASLWLPSCPLGCSGLLMPLLRPLQAPECGLAGLLGADGFQGPQCG